MNRYVFNLNTEKSVLQFEFILFMLLWLTSQFLVSEWGMNAAALSASDEWTHPMNAQHRHQCISVTHRLHSQNQIKDAAAWKESNLPNEWNNKDTYFISAALLKTRDQHFRYLRQDLFNNWLTTNNTFFDWAQPCFLATCWHRLCKSTHFHTCWQWFCRGVTHPYLSPLTSPSSCCLLFLMLFTGFHHSLFHLWLSLQFSLYVQRLTWSV